jgi:hypothetical protein
VVVEVERIAEEDWTAFAGGVATKIGFHGVAG